MLKRDYTHIKIPEPEILAMKKGNVLIDNYIDFYNHRRIRLKLIFSFREAFLCCPYNPGLFNDVSQGLDFEKLSRQRNIYFLQSGEACRGTGDTAAEPYINEVERKRKNKQQCTR